MNYLIIPAEGCGVKEFKVNGINSSEYDFGNLEEVEDEIEDDENICHGLDFVTFDKESLEAKLCMKKYHLTEKEFCEIAETLSDKLSIELALCACNDNKKRLYL